jgi:DNA (cytosine-5)-methyltransferase 1
MLGFASLFTGGGGAELGAIQAGLTPIWGIEKDPDIVNVSQKNFDHPIIKTDLLAYSKMDFGWRVIKKEYKAPDWLHASPPCVRASSANNGTETQEDIDLAQAICRAIEVLNPEYFSLENVSGYRNFLAFTTILLKLESLGYHHDARIVDCSCYGVPQSRKRLFLVASKKHSVMNWCDRLQEVEKKIGWYEAIADLVPTLNPTTLTDWQKKAIIEKARLQTSFNTNKPFVIQRSGARKKDGIPNNTIRLKDEPMFTIKAMSGEERPSVKQATLIIDGKPYEADTRCLARWQTFPDDYQWSGDLKLDTKIIGNAVPPKFFAQLIKGVIQ